MHKTTNKKRYETPCLITAEVECVSLMAQSPEPPQKPSDEVVDKGEDGLVKGMSLWDEGW